MADLNIARGSMEAEEHSEDENKQMRLKLYDLSNKLNNIQSCVDTLIAECDVPHQTENDKETVRKFIDRYCQENPDGRINVPRFKELLCLFSQQSGYRISARVISRIMMKDFPQFRCHYDRGRSFYEGLEWKTYVSELESGASLGSFA